MSIEFFLYYSYILPSVVLLQKNETMNVQRFIITRSI